MTALEPPDYAGWIVGLFIETHEEPDNAPCDGPNMIQIDDMPALTQQLRYLVLGFSLGSAIVLLRHDMTKPRTT